MDYERRIIENTKEAKMDFGIAHGVEKIELTNEMIDALKDGKCIAVDINCGEYVGFITLKKE